MTHKLNETMVDSAIGVSLTARLDGAIVGFLMARADYGDFGRTEPVAVIDTIGVDPAGHTAAWVTRCCRSSSPTSGAAHRAGRDHRRAARLRLLGFLYDVGFVPSQRLPFVRRLDAGA